MNKQKQSVNTLNHPLSFFDVANYILADMPERAQEIVKKRFGINGGKPQTLERIGNDYGITRERVRQIIMDALKKISKDGENEHFKKAENKIIFTIDESNGIIKEKDIINKLSAEDQKEANALSFICLGSSRIISIEQEGIEKSWALNKKTVDKVKEVGSVIESILNREHELLSDEEMIKKVMDVRQDATREEIICYVKVLSGIRKNNFGKWGIAEWIEISPKGTRERIYTVLKEKGSPMHFTEIAKMIDQFGLSKRKAHIQTVHNELIKNEQFVLVGRGIYALKEWGYSKGTIQDVLENILAKSRKSLTKEEILKEVSLVRQVKKATVLINLSNSKLFIKQNSHYSIKKQK